MTQYRFALASPDDDEALRLRMAEDIMQGPVSVSFRRSPSYFAGSRLQGRSSQVIACREEQSGRIVGLGTRASLPTYVNGLDRNTGYLCDLRGDTRVRGGTLLARGYRYLRQLHQANPLPLYYTMILDGNETALSLLSSGRAQLPRYRAMGKFNTPALLLGGKRNFRYDSQLRMAPARCSDLDRVLQFVNQNYRRFQFAPVLERDDFFNGRLSGLRVEDIVVAWIGDRIVGVTACWDQSATRQIHIESYTGALRLARPLYNSLARVMPHKALPAAGQSLACFYCCMIAIEDDDPLVFTHLLEHIYASRRIGPWQLFFVGLHERHPCSPVLDQFRQIRAAGHLFAVHWPEHQAAFDELDQRVAHVEAAAL